ncbi:hypothetical protein WJX84_010437 [Apatococcus fuscideae]|uniref:Uncharacterized protein n=1 Tax=Apatococcus fuscideae TaxID=2026836 RepID=A0AAW1SM60_9CHLO
MRLTCACQHVQRPPGSLARPPSRPLTQVRSRVQQVASCLTDGPQYKPAYNKYRTRQKIDEDVIKEWKYVTGSTSPRVPLRPWTLALSMAGIIKFYLVPEQLRFIIHIAWAFLQHLGSRANKQLVLQGVKLDAKLAEIGSGGTSKAFSKAMALRRWHGKISPWANLSYRLSLWRGVSLTHDQSMLQSPPLTTTGIIAT